MSDHETRPHHSSSPAGDDDKPSLPSIQSLFGIRREDNLETLLPPPPLESSAYPEGDAGESVSKADPGASYSPTEAASTSPRLSRPPRPRSTVYESHPTPSLSHRRVAVATSEPSLESEAGPSSRASRIRRPSDPSRSPPGTPELSSSSRMDSRTASRQLHSPRFPSYSPATTQQSLRPGSSSRPQTSASFGHDDQPHPSLPPRTTHSSLSSMSSATSSFYRPTMPPPYSATASVGPSSSESIPTADGVRRRHTISEDRGAGAIRSPRVRSRQPSPSPYTLSRRRTSPAPSGHEPYRLSTDSPRSTLSERTLPPLPGLSPQSESQHHSSRPTLPPPSAYAPPYHRPGPYSRPTTAPGGSYPTSHPPSSYPRRMSTGEHAGSSAIPPPYIEEAAGSSYSAHAGTTTSPSAPTGHQRPQGYDQGRHRLYSATEVIGHYNVPPLEKSTASSSSLSIPATITPGERHKYECPYCKKGFNRPSSLKIHVNTHTGEKPFQCTVPGCDRRFSVMSNMRRHARTHDQQRFMGGAVFVEDVVEDESPESPTLEEASGSRDDNPPPLAGPSSPPSRSTPRGVGRPRSPKTMIRSKVPRRTFPGVFQEPSMENVGLLRPASPTPTPPPGERLVVPPMTSLAGTAHQLYQETQHAPRRLAQSPPPPSQPQEVGGSSTVTVTAASTTTRVSPRGRGKRRSSPQDASESPKAAKRAKSNPDTDTGSGGSGGTSPPTAPRRGRSKRSAKSKKG